MTPEHFAHQPPGTYTNLPVLILSITMLYFSNRRKPTRAEA
jgi:hypothetical protein